MAATAIVVSTVLSATAIYMSYEAQQEQAKRAGRAAKREAAYAKERATLEEQIAAERHALDIFLAEERIAFEKEIGLERTTFTIEQIAKRDAEVRAAAIAGYAASGIDPYEEGSSALAVLKRIERESTIEQERVMKGYETFVGARELELEQLRESRGKTFEWFMAQSKMETQYEIQSRLAEASAYRSQARYAGYGKVLGPLAALGSGATMYAGLPKAPTPSTLMIT